ncbi:putative glycosyltransferase [Desulfitobacterium dehalogenans ATCC 51507]|uniref:Putative glycosyltransferase n=1 Tax=Desulfitobacterium dehalogenans (strain ATCC 51507 / DSM 9161 / JW/IU-DC1) TaxID=756499 RepID=I4ACZ0_DESDJ|nr:glycosyltransferase [Desulfitobacterium dehalogenans]AFM01825.1 putative glycosyltransferase [Desulfitobacterium dehalogenans ATCC 51507]
MNEKSNQIIQINTNDKKMPEPGGDIYIARDNVSMTISELNAPLVSVIVVGYNNLYKHTKICVECILNYTLDEDYELILVDNGSTDGTLEFFESVKHPKKKIIKITKNIGLFFGINSGIEIARGKFIAVISNDIYVTKNWLANLLKCAFSDERIGMIVPVSDNVSNLQAVDLDFNDFEDMQKKAAEFNKSNPRKWHEHLRLITAMAFYRRTCLDMLGKQDYGFFHDFGDDDITFRVRRAGYKAILCKDVFVQHAGIATRDPEVIRMSLEKGRTAFQEKYYGIDAWDDVNNFETSMMSFVKANKVSSKYAPNILGVDVRCGTPILELKNTLREQGSFNAELSAFSTKAKYWFDLKTICNGRVETDRPEYILQHFEEGYFNYIVVGQPLNSYGDPFLMLGYFLRLLKSDGQLLLKIRNTYDIGTFLKIMGFDVTTKDIHNLHHISIEELSEHLNTQGYFVKDVSIEQHSFNKEIKELLDSFNFTDNNAYIKATAKDFVINIKRS